MLVAGLDIGTSSICGLLYDAGTDNIAETVNSKNEAHIRSTMSVPISTTAIYMWPLPLMGEGYWLSWRNSFPNAVKS